MKNNNEEEEEINVAEIIKDNKYLNILYLKYFSKNKIYC